ncbi:MAG TPA: aminopeptidase, partial [Candidatus Omnitrophica bacterium]|nr:aminopeptidase [Candidatus Omnitrophota bacterium]
MDQINNIEIHLEKYFDRLWPICRSIVSPGYRESLDILSEIVPFERLEFPTGKKVLDWTVPEEWDCRDAYFIDSQGVRHADFKVNNLHILNFSAPFRGKVNFEEMQKHLYSLPHLPDAVPYITSYYEKRWGFCISENERKNLPQGDFEVFIDSVHRHGKLVAGEAVLKGQTKQEILLSSYLCHPSLANNELSGPLVLAFLYDALKKKAQRKFTYRFVVVPETIGSIAYLSKRGEHLRRNVV